jgi:hypothetical protein
MSIKYLDKFASKIGKRQADQVLQLLNEKRQAGEIRTVDEFISRLDNLIRDLTSTTLAPTLKIFEAEEDEVIDSETFNYMLDRVRDDLKAGFEESENIDEIQRSHRAIMRDMVLKQIRRAINELNSKLSIYEKKKLSGNDASEIIFSTFDLSEGRTSRNGISQPGILFSDPRTGKSIEKNAYIEEVGDRLTLSKKTSREYIFKKAVQVFDSTYPQSQVVVQLPDTKLSNIIDRTNDTYWIQSLLFENIQPYAKIRLQLNIDTERDINYLEIEPVSDKGLILEAIDYEDSALNIQSISNTDVDLNQPVRVNFQRVSVGKVFLTFRNENAIPTDFEYNPDVQELSYLLHNQQPGGDTPDLSGISEVLNDIVPSPTVKDIVGILTKDRFEFSGYSYLFGLDNVRVGLSLYDRESIYVSQSKRVEDLGQVYLTTDETRPVASSVTATPSNTTTTYDGTDSNFYFSSIEYWVIKRDVDSEGNVIATNRYPILPRTNDRINHERLPLIEKSNASLDYSDTGKTMFFVDRTAGSVKVYRNGNLLVYGADWTDATENKTPNSGSAMEFKIKIENPLIGDIYTVTYTPSFSNTRGIPDTLSEFTGSGIDIVDLRGDLSVRYVDNNTLLFNKGNLDKEVFASDIFMCIILKNNSSRNALSAAVEEFTLSMGTKDISKTEDFNG